MYTCNLLITNKMLQQLTYMDWDGRTKVTYVYNLWIFWSQMRCSNYSATEIRVADQRLYVISSTCNLLRLLRCSKKWELYYRLKHTCTTLKVTVYLQGCPSLTDVAHALYIAYILTPYQIEAYKICYKNIAILFDSNKSASFLRPIYEAAMTAFHSKWFLFLNNPIQSAKKPCRVFFIFDASETLCNVL